MSDGTVNWVIFCICAPAVLAATINPGFSDGLTPDGIRPMALSKENGQISRNNTTLQAAYENIFGALLSSSRAAMTNITAIPAVRLISNIFKKILSVMSTPPYTRLLAFEFHLFLCHLVFSFL